MNRTARAAVTLPLIVLVAGGLVEIACRGGPLDELDGGYNDGEATRPVPGSATVRDGGVSANGDACALVTSEDDAGPGCASDD